MITAFFYCVVPYCVTGGPYRVVLFLIVFGDQILVVLCYCYCAAYCVSPWKTEGESGLKRAQVPMQGAVRLVRSNGRPQGHV